jgi:hypothetical protein
VVVAAVVPDAQQAALLVAAAVPVAQQAAVMAAAVVPVAQQAVAAVVVTAVLDVQQEAAVAATQRAVRPLVLSVAATEVDRQRAASRRATTVRQIWPALVRFWIRAVLFSGRTLVWAPEWPRVPVAVWQALIDPREVVCRLRAAAAVRLIPAVADHLWFQEEWFSALLVARAVSAKEKAAAGQLWFPEPSASALGQV